MASDSRASVVSDRPELSDLSSTTETVEAARNRAVAQLRELVAERKVAPWQTPGFLERCLLYTSKSPPHTKAELV